MFLTAIYLKIDSAEGALHATKALRAFSTQGHAAAPHVADFGFVAGCVGAVRAHHTGLALEGVVDLHQGAVVLHSFGDPVPEGGVERRMRGPVGGCTIGITSGVLVLPYWAVLLDREGSKGGDIRIESVGLVDIEAACVDLVQAVAGVEVSQRSHGGTNPSRGQGIGGILDGTVVGIVDHKLVLMRMAKEDVGNNVWAVTIDNLVKEVGRVRQRVAPIPAGKNVTHDPDTLACILGALQLLDQELEASRHIWVSGVDEVEVVRLVPEICVDSDDAETVLDLD